MWLLLIGLSALRFHKFWSKDDPEIITSSQFINLNTEGRVDFFKAGFDFGFNTVPEMPPEIGEVVATYIHQRRVDDDGNRFEKFERSYERIKMHKCEAGRDFQKAVDANALF